MRPASKAIAVGKSRPVTIALSVYPGATKMSGIAAAPAAGRLRPPESAGGISGYDGPCGSGFDGELSRSVQAYEASATPSEASAKVPRGSVLMMPLHEQRTCPVDSERSERQMNLRRARQEAS